MCLQISKNSFFNPKLHFAIFCEKIYSILYILSSLDIAVNLSN